MTHINEYITEKQYAKCRAVIHGASVAAGGFGVGLCWVPASEIPLISAVQIAMAISLGKVFDIKLTKSAAVSAVAAVAATAAATVVGRAASRLGCCGIPFVNYAINAGTAVGLTEFVGWKLAEQFARQAAEEAERVIA